MLINICLVLVTVSLISVLIILIRISAQLKTTLQLLQSDFHNVSQAATDTLHSVSNLTTYLKRWITPAIFIRNFFQKRRTNL